LVDRDFDNHDFPLQQGHFRVATRLPRSTRLKDQGLIRFFIFRYRWLRVYPGAI